MNLKQWEAKEGKSSSYRLHGCIRHIAIIKRCFYTCLTVHAISTKCQMLKKRIRMQDEALVSFSLDVITVPATVDKTRL